MQLAALLRETLDVDSQDVWANERTPIPTRRFWARLHAMRLSVRETVAVQIGAEWYRLCAAVDLDSLYLLDIEVFSRHDTDPAAAFLHTLTEKHDVADAEFLVDAYGYRTALARLNLSGRVEYSERKNDER